MEPKNLIVLLMSVGKRENCENFSLNNTLVGDRCAGEWRMWNRRPCSVFMGRPSDEFPQCWNL